MSNIKTENEKTITDSLGRIITYSSSPDSKVIKIVHMKYGEICNNCEQEYEYSWQDLYVSKDKRLFTMCPYCQSYNEHKINIYRAAAADSGDTGREPAPAKTKDTYTLVALFGPSGAGKDYLLNNLCAKVNTFNRAKSYTTRAPRENEDDKDYYFVSKENFAKHLFSGEILETTEWDDEMYGTARSSLDPNKINVKVLDPTGIEIILDSYPEIDIYPVYIAAPEKERLLRVLNREKNPDCEKICRRFLQDNKVFDTDFNFEFYEYYNSDKIDPNTLYQYLKYWIGF